MSVSTKQKNKHSQRYANASKVYAEIGIDTDACLKTLGSVPISLHCWQGDDVGGFENRLGLSGGILATGNYPGKAQSPQQLRADIEQALRLVAGSHRVNLHAIYAETDSKMVERNQLTKKQFEGWTDWAQHHKIGLDFNPTFFSHPMAASGFTLSSTDESVRKYWIEHGISCRHIGAHFGKTLGKTCITNFWIPDGYKDVCIDRKAHREILVDSLDKIFSVKIESKYNKDAIESKLFGIGSESYVTGSHEFYMGYAFGRKKIPCLDMGHFHPTESIADKISSILLYANELLLHVSRGIRWDSDHVVLFDDEIKRVSEEVVRCQGLDRVHIALDYFDASINRIAAWVVGMRSTQKAILYALLQPHEQLKQLELSGDFTGRMVLLESLKTLPMGDVWDHFCAQNYVPAEDAWLKEVRDYERTTNAARCPVQSGPANELELLDDLAQTSHFLGLDNDYVQVGGGNTSIKSPDGSRMYIKASGSSLADMSREKGWVCVDLARALFVLEDEKLENMPRDKREDETKKRLQDAVDHPADRRPSVETFLHAMLDTVVMHSHPVAANALNCHPKGDLILAQLNKDEKVPALWVPYVDPGIKLAFCFGRVVAAFKRKHGNPPSAVFLENHGFICAAPTATDAQKLHLHWMNRLENYFGQIEKESNTVFDKAGKSLSRALANSFDKKLIVRPAKNRELVMSANTEAWRVLDGALTPDHVVYEGASALCIADSKEIPDQHILDKEVACFAEKYFTYPRIVVIIGVGVFMVGEAESQLDATEIMAVSALRIAARTGGVYKFMPKENVDFIMNWEVEKFRAGMLAKSDHKKK